MYWIGAPFRLLYKVYVGIVYMSIGLILNPYMLIALRGKNKLQRSVRVKKVWSSIILFLGFVKVKIHNNENFPKKGPYIVCANHASYLDIIVMYKIIPHDFAFLGKSEVLKWPIINIFFKRNIDIPVVRGNRVASAKSLLQSKKALKSGRILAIFPEGKMVDSPPTMARFKNGAFSMAIEQEVPIVPITYANNYKLFSDHVDLFGAGSPGISHVIVHPQINVDSDTDLVSLRNKTYDLIKKDIR